MCADQGLNGTNAELNSLLHDELHVASLRNGLAKGDGVGRLSRSLALYNMAAHLVTINGTNPADGRSSLSIKDLNGIPFTCAHDAGTVFGLLPGEYELFVTPIASWYVEAVHGRD